MKNYLVGRNGGLSLFDDAFDGFFRPFFYGERFDCIKTDIRETDQAFVIEAEMPGFAKEDISLSIENGYLNIGAKKSEKDEGKQRYICKERSLSCSRSYYVGEVDESGAKAKYENGVLTVAVPKIQEKLPEKKSIAIE